MTRDAMERLTEYSVAQSREIERLRSFFIEAEAALNRFIPYIEGAAEHAAKQNEDEETVARVRLDVEHAYSLIAFIKGERR